MHELKASYEFFTSCESATSYSPKFAVLPILSLFQNAAQMVKTSAKQKNDKNLRRFGVRTNLIGGMGFFSFFRGTRCTKVGTPDLDHYKHRDMNACKLQKFVFWLC